MPNPTSPVPAPDFTAIVSRSRRRMWPFLPRAARRRRGPGRGACRLIAPRRPAGEPIALFGEAVLDAAPSGTTPGGAPFNVACHLGRLGFEARLLTRVGADAGGREILRAIRACGLPRSGVQVDPRVATRRASASATAPHGPSFEIPARQAFDAIDARAARAAFVRARPGLLYFGTLAQRCRALPRRSRGAPRPQASPPRSST